jgi:hypothetical protein
MGFFNINNAPRVNSINGTALVIASGTIGAIAGFLWMDDFASMARYKQRINNGAAAGAVAGVILGSLLTGSTWLAQRS